MKTSATKARKHSCQQLQRDQTEQCQCILMSMEKLKQKLPSQHKINPGIMADAKSCHWRRWLTKCWSHVKEAGRQGMLTLEWAGHKRDIKMVTVDSELRLFKCWIHSNPIVQQTSTSPPEHRPSSTPPCCGVCHFLLLLFTSIHLFGHGFNVLSSMQWQHLILHQLPQPWWFIGCSKFNNLSSGWLSLLFFFPWPF